MSTTYTYAGSFPTSPAEGETLLMNGTTYQRSSGYWRVLTGSVTGSVSGGGSGSTISDLTDIEDITTTGLANHDMLIYNGTDLEWNNTNVGLTNDPTLSGDSTAYAGVTYEFTITNAGQYVQPQFFVEVYSGSTKVVENSDVTKNSDGTIQFSTPITPGTIEIRVTVQDFGALKSEVVTKSITTSTLGGTYRYWRFTGMTPVSGQWLMVSEISLYPSPSQQGTKQPSNMTSDVLPSPYVASVDTEYNATYIAHDAFDGLSNTFYWAIGSTDGASEWIQIDLGSSMNISSFKIISGNGAGYNPTSYTIIGSNTGAFSGEETTIGVFAVQGDNTTTYKITNIG